MYIESNLARLGYSVCGMVSSGEDAVVKAGELKPDLILMDILLSGPMNGIEAARIIKENLSITVI
jgi:CheY-like chemotaxis protein